MSSKHPYISSRGALVQLLDQLKSSFPQTLTSEVLKKLSIAPGNESYAINIIRFLGLIDDKGVRTDAGHKVFTLHNDAEFQQGFAAMIKAAYKDLFDLRGDVAWGLPEDQLIPYFRQSDQSTALVGGRQATTFKALAAYAGFADPESAKIATPGKPKQKVAAKGKKAAGNAATSYAGAAVQGGRQTDDAKTSDSEAGAGSPAPSNVGLTVRIEVNLPAAGDQETYDRIFRSIRENLLNG